MLYSTDTLYSLKVVCGVHFRSKFYPCWTEDFALFWLINKKIGPRIDKTGLWKCDIGEYILFNSFLIMSVKSDRVRKNLVAGESPGELLGSSAMAETDADQSDLYSLELMKDFPPGPLDHYRQKASFCYKKMRLFLEGEEIIRFKVRHYCNPGNFQ